MEISNKKKLKQTEKLSKRTNRKQNFKAFIESNYTDYNAFIKACKNDEDLLIYTCLKKEELIPYIEKIKTLDTLEEKIKYLVDIHNQPYMNETPERYERCIESIAYYLRSYIQYNGFKMANSDGDYEDWTSTFWLKYTKICNFYRDRWFYPENLKKKSTVEYNLMLYKEFVYICRMSITGERKHQAFLATQRPESSVFKTSLDFKFESNKKDSDKTLLDVLQDSKNNSDINLVITHTSTLIKKALQLSKEYEGGKYTEDLKRYYDTQDSAGFDKKTIILGKIFLYKAGLVSIKTLSFIKSLSNTYKSKFNINSALVNKQLSELKKKKVVKPSKPDDIYENPNSYITKILKKRGSL